MNLENHLTDTWAAVVRITMSGAAVVASYVGAKLENVVLGDFVEVIALTFASLQLFILVRDKLLRIGSGSKKRWWEASAPVDLDPPQDGNDRK